MYVGDPTTYVPSMANNGIIDFDSAYGDMANSAATGGWWSVDLGGMYNVSCSRLALRYCFIFITHTHTHTHMIYCFLNGSRARVSSFARLHACSRHSLRLTQCMHMH